MYYVYPSQPSYTIVHPDELLLHQQRRQRAYEAQRRAYEEHLYRQALEEELLRRRAEEERQRRAYEEEMLRRKAIQEELEHQRALDRQRMLEAERARLIEEELIRRELERSGREQEEERKKAALYAALVEEGLRREKEKEMWKQRVAEKQREMEKAREWELKRKSRDIVVPEIVQQAAKQKPNSVRREIPITFVPSSSKPTPMAIEQAHSNRPSTPKVPKPQQVEPSPDPITTFTRTHAARTLQNHYRTTLPKLRTLATILQDLRTAQQALEFTTLSTPLTVTDGKVLPQHNKAFITYEETLMKLLVRADAVQSTGSKLVRERRKNVVRDINSVMEKLDEIRREAILQWEVEHEEKMQVDNAEEVVTQEFGVELIEVEPAYDTSLNEVAVESDFVDVMDEEGEQEPAAKTSDDMVEPESEVENDTLEKMETPDDMVQPESAVGNETAEEQVEEKTVESTFERQPAEAETPAAVHEQQIDISESNAMEDASAAPLADPQESNNDTTDPMTIDQTHPDPTTSEQSPLLENTTPSSPTDHSTTSEDWAHIPNDFIVITKPVESPATLPLPSAEIPKGELMIGCSVSA